jgi:spore germination protein GerM
MPIRWLNIQTVSRRYSHRVLSSCFALSLLVVGACSNPSTEEPFKTLAPAVSEVPAATPAPVADPIKEAEVRVYYADSELINLQSKSVKISYQSNEEKISLAMGQLREKPESPLISLFTSITFQSIQFKDGMLTIDLSIPQEGHYGASGEELAVRALTETAFQFDEVKSLDILLNGKQEETLMGHIELSHPIRK